MKVITPGYKYELDHHESFGLPGCPVQTLQFIEKKLTGDADHPSLTTVNDGTTNEEVLRVLIDRVLFLDAKFPSDENKVVIAKLDAALKALEERTAARKLRGVEGKPAV